MGHGLSRAVIADDDPFFRIALVSILTTHLGFSEVHQVGSLDEALEALAEGPDLRFAVFDLAMPGMESPASLSAVRECFPEVLTAVVSGSTEREDVFQALRAGVHGFVEKATSVEAMIEALRMILEGRVHVPTFVTRVRPVTEGPLTNRSSSAPRDRAPVPVTCEAMASLTPRQRQVLDLIVEGQSNKEIARSLSLGEGTVKIHVATLLKVLKVPNRSAAAAWGSANRAHIRTPAAVE